MRVQLLWIISCSCLLASCGGGQKEPAPIPPMAVTPVESSPAPTLNLAIPDRRGESPLNILWFGNSHTHGYNLPDLVATLLKTGAKLESQMLIADGLAYLDERWGSARDQQLLHRQQWNAVVLQAQKYSTSGLYQYSTQAAEQWIAAAKQQRTMPVLYPEHPQQGDRTEGQKVFQLHQQISQRQQACVAPIGPAWDLAISLWPSLQLYARDGNHFNEQGALLTAYVFYEVFSKQSADLLPDLPELAAPIAVQRQLRQAASMVLQQYPACMF